MGLYNPGNPCVVRVYGHFAKSRVRNTFSRTCFLAIANFTQEESAGPQQLYHPRSKPVEKSIAILFVCQRLPWFEQTGFRHQGCKLIFGNVRWICHHEIESIVHEAGIKDIGMENLDPVEAETGRIAPALCNSRFADIHSGDMDIGGVMRNCESDIA